MNIRLKKRIFNIAVGLMLAAAIVWVCAKFVHLGNVEFTDNAQVRQLIVPVNTRVQGFIKKIYFDENQYFKKGDTLLVIEDTEYRYRVAQAEADYTNALVGKQMTGTTIQTTQSNIGETEAGIEESRIRMENAERDYNRYHNLLKDKSVTQQQFDAVKTEYDAAKARYEQLLRRRNSTTLVRDEQTLRLDQNDAAVKLALAGLELARLNLSYTVVVAPCNGVTGRKTIEEGQLVQPGQVVVNLVNADDMWVIANYKETQTANIRAGMEVEISVDAVPDATFRGRVHSLSQATGASFSLFPQDNTSGNFVKVEQRIPVRIEFAADNRPDDMARLRAGMNVECQVKY